MCTLLNTVFFKKHIFSGSLLNRHFSMCPKRSCKTISTTVSEMASSNYTNADKVSPTVILNFRPTVQVTKSIPKVTFVTVINDIGSSMGLWLGASVFSIFKMVKAAPAQWSSSYDDLLNMRSRLTFAVTIFATLVSISMGIGFFYMSFA